MIPKTQRNHSAAQRSAAKRAVPLSAKAPKKSAANNTQGREA
jgi:hypothetical protein